MLYPRPCLPEPAEVAEVLPNLRRRHLQQLAQLLGADYVDAVRFQVREGPQVLRETLDDDLGHFGGSGHAVPGERRFRER